MYSQDDSIGGRSIYHTIRMIHEDTGASACVDLMLDQRLRRWSNIKLTQAEYVQFSGNISDPTYN